MNSYLEQGETEARLEGRIRELETELAESQARAYAYLRRAEIAEGYINVSMVRDRSPEPDPGPIRLEEEKVSDLVLAVILGSVAVLFAFCVGLAIGMWL